MTQKTQKNIFQIIKKCLKIQILAEVLLGYLLLSLIWFSYNIYQSYKYLGDEWSYNSINVTHNERETEFMNNVCGSWSKKVLEKLQDPSYWGKFDRWKNTEKDKFNQQWFRKT